MPLGVFVRQAVAMSFKPMLAASVDDVAALRFPLLVSPKLDGIRCVIRDGQVLSRSLKFIPNAYVRACIEQFAGHVEGLDGELMLADERATFQEISSAIMSRDGAPDFRFWAFDYLHPRHPEQPFYKRYVDMLALILAMKKGRAAPWLGAVRHERITSADELAVYEREMLADGFEGVMLRDPAGPYKHGRSTLREGYLLKLKRFTDAEAVIVGFEEQEQNTNVQTRDELGRAKRSTHNAGKVGKGTLGAFIVRAAVTTNSATGVIEAPEFRIGTGQGLTAKLRQEIWNDRARYLGRIVKYRYQEVGTKDAPRIPVWLGFRDERDL